MKVQVVITGVVVLLIGFFVVWPPRARKGGKPTPCFSNLRDIQQAKQTWALDERKMTNDVPTDKDLFGPDKALINKPLCPNGGVYTLGAVGERPRCSVPGHSL